MATRSGATRSGRLRSSISRWASSTGHDARELRATSVAAGCCPIAEAEDRQRATIQGVLRTVTLRPRGGVPALEAELYDGSAVITLIWLGRRRIVGVEPGRSIKVEGRVGGSQGTRVMYNPRYELRP
jgi:hypothetical protein